MRDQVIQTSVSREIPVRWIERSWSVEVGAGEPGEPVQVPARGSRGSKRDIAIPAEIRSTRRIAVTTRKRFSQPSRAQRHRR